MIQLLILSLTFSICSTLLTSQSEITYQDFGDGWVIPINQATEIDMDDDGIIDFSINQKTNELGFSPIFAKRCFTSPA